MVDQKKQRNFQNSKKDGTQIWDFWLEWQENKWIRTKLGDLYQKKKPKEGQMWAVINVMGDRRAKIWGGCMWHDLFS